MLVNFMIAPARHGSRPSDDVAMFATGDAAFRVPDTGRTVSARHSKVGVAFAVPEYNKTTLAEIPVPPAPVTTPEKG